MLPIILIGAIASLCYAKLPGPKAEAVVSWNGNTTRYAYALDFSVRGTQSVFSCIKALGYSTVFLRAYDPTGRGGFDNNAVSNIRLASKAGLGVEVYMTPLYRSYKKGSQQFEELYHGLNSAHIQLKTVWLQVTSPRNWDSYSQNNIYFLNQLITTAQKYKVNVAFYTNAYDWKSITNAAWVDRSSMLWYYNVRSGGPAGESPANFADFVPFGVWSTPTVKQFGQVEHVCGVTVNRDVYSVNKGVMRDVTVKGKNGQDLVVGGTFASGFSGLLKSP